MSRSVELYVGAWVPGKRPATQLGPVEAGVFVSDDPVTSRERRTQLAETRVFEDLRERAAELDANAVTSIELCVDLFASEEGRKGTWLRATGTAARLDRARARKVERRGEELVGLLQ